MQLFDFGAHGHPQLGVEVGERLVKQKHLRVSHDGATHGDTLTLPARELAWIAVQEGMQAQNTCCHIDPLGNHLCWLFGQQQRKRHVVAYRHVRVERIVLEHHGDVTLFGWHVVDTLFPNINIAARDFFETRDHAQQGGFAATRGANKDAKFAIGDIHADTLNDVCAAKVLVYLTYGDAGHGKLRKRGAHWAQHCEQAYASRRGRPSGLTR